MVITMSKFFSWIAVLLLTAVTAQSQSSQVFTFYGSVGSTDSAKLSNARVTLYRNNMPIQTGFIKEDGKFFLKLLSNQNYKIEISQLLYASQMLEVSTQVPEGMDAEIPPFTFDVKLFPYWENVNYEVLDDPIERIYISKDTAIFQKDIEHFNQYKLSYEQLKNGVNNWTKKNVRHYYYDLDDEGKKEFDEKRRAVWMEFNEERLDRIYGAKLQAMQEIMAGIENKKNKVKDQAAPISPLYDQVPISPEEQEGFYDLDEDGLEIDSFTENNTQTDSIKKDTIKRQDLALAERDFQIKDDNILPTIEKTKDTALYQRLMDSIIALSPNSKTRKEIKDSINRSTPNNKDSVFTIQPNLISLEIAEIIYKDSAIQELSASTIKNAIELVEIIDTKKENQIELDVINEEEEKQQKLMIINRIEHAVNKRKFLEILAEAKTDLKKQEIIQKQ